MYATRKEMDEKCHNDGVYPGRYVLVEYGERYELRKDDSGNILYDPDTNQPLRDERAEYRENYDLDHDFYGNVYDSTVWQKVYTKQNSSISNTYGEKYIMVAELNALVPKLTLVEDETATLKSGKGYIPVSQNAEFDPSITYFIYGGLDDEGNPTYLRQVNIDGFAEGIQYYYYGELTLYYGDDNVLLHNVHAIEANHPYFDETQDTELEYILHMPKPLELDVNKDVEYHAEKFDIYHSYLTESEGGNFIGWKPKPEKEANKVSNVDNQDPAQGKTINSDTQFSKQELNMYLPAFGDVLGALYDTLFGKATTDGGLRPYFDSMGVTEASILDPTAFTGDADISRILANNSEGLAGILSALFADNSIPGQVRYYLSADWLAQNTSLDTNTPGILNKPKVVFKDGDDRIDASFNTHYKIDYNTWMLTNILFSIIKNISGVESSNPKYTTAIENIIYSDLGHSLQIIGDVEDFNANNKTIKLDITTAFSNAIDRVKIYDANNTLLESPTIQANSENTKHLFWTFDLGALNSITDKRASYKITAQGSEDIELLIELISKHHLFSGLDKAASTTTPNQDKFSIIQTANSRFVIVGALDQLQNYELNGQVGKWICLSGNTKDSANNILLSQTHNDQYQFVKTGQGNFNLYLNFEKLDLTYYNTNSITDEPTNSESNIIKTAKRNLTLQSTTLENQNKKFNDVVLDFTFVNMPLLNMPLSNAIKVLSSVPNNIENKAAIENNISGEVLTMTQENNIIRLQGDFQNFEHFVVDNEDGHWVPLVIDTPITDLRILKVNNQNVTSEQQTVSSSLTNSNNKLVLWIKLEDAENKTYNLNANIVNLVNYNNYRYADQLLTEINAMSDYLSNNTVSSNFIVTFQGEDLLQSIFALPVESVPIDGNEVAARNNQSSTNLSIVPDTNATHTYHVKVKLDDGCLQSYPSTNPNQGTAKWIGIVIKTNCTEEPYQNENDEWIGGITAINWNGQGNLGSMDIADAKSLGLEDGEIILWLKAENLTTREITLSADHYTASTLRLIIEEQGRHTISYNRNNKGTANYTKESQTSYDNESLTVEPFFNNAYYLVDKDKYIDDVSERFETNNLSSAAIEYNLQGGTWEGDITPGIVKWASDVYSYPQTSWNTQADGSGDSYQANSSYIDSNSNTLYAIWRDNYILTPKQGREYILPTSSLNTNPERWSPYRGAPHISVASINFYPEANSQEGKTEITALVIKHEPFLEWQNEDNIVRTTNLVNSTVTTGETIHAIYDAADRYKTSPITLPSITKENYTLLGWSDDSQASEILEGFEPGESVIYYFTDSNKINNLNFYAVWAAYLQIFFKDLTYGNTTITITAPHGQEITLLNYFNDYVENAVQNLTITIDDTDIDSWDTTNGNSTTASATYATSQTRYQQIGWSHANDNNSPYVEYDNFNTNNSDEEFIALWNTGNIESIEPTGLSYIIPSAIPIKNDITENTGYTVTYYYTDTNNEIQQLMQVPITKTTDYSFDSWIEVNTEEIRTNNSRVTSNETIKPIFIPTDNGNNATILYNGDLPNNMVYSGWETLNHNERFLPGETVIFDNSIELYAYLGL